MTKRLLELEPSGLFGEKAILMEFSGREEISRPFEFSLTIASPKESIQPEDVIGKTLAVRLDRDDQEPRYFHGYISHFWAGDFSMTEGKEGLPSRLYRVRLVPWIWFMTRSARSFVYLPEKAEKSIQDVLDEVIKRVKSYKHVETWHDAAAASILKSRKVEHCVQYRETDFNFLIRTLETYGVYYYFKFEKDKHTMVLSDKSNYPKCVESEIELASSTGNYMTMARISNWEHGYEFVSGKWVQSDYNFLTPSTSLKVTANKHGAITLGNNGEYELYEWPNDYANQGDGKTEAIRRMEEEEIRFNTVRGESACKTMTPGYTFKLDKHASCKDEEGKSYLLTSVTHYASQPGPLSSSLNATYSNQFACVPRDLQYRAPRMTSHPILSNIQTAVVVGPAGEEIYTDKYGRVKVQFHWDREGKRDENTCCWVRVSQIHAGKGFGGIDIPRIGEEVIISFVEGDPDRPVVTGRLYHAESMPPFTLPEQKTRSGIKTKTYKKGKEHFNELSMDDATGKEQVFLHAEKNYDIEVENDETHWVGHNRTKMIDNDEQSKIGNNRTKEVVKDESVTIGANRRKMVGQNETISIGQTIGLTVGQNMKIDISGDQSATVGKNSETTIAGERKETVGKNDTLQVAANRSVSVDKNDSLSVKDQLVVEAGKEIIFKTGAATIEMKKDGSILIKGKDIKIDGSGSIDIKASKDVKVKGKKITQN